MAKPDRTVRLVQSDESSSVKEELDAIEAEILRGISLLEVLARAVGDDDAELEVSTAARRQTSARCPQPHGPRVDSARPGGELLVGPGAALTHDLRALIRDNKPAILEALAAESRAAPGEVLCRECSHFNARQGAQPDGWCRRCRAETWAGLAEIDRTVRNQQARYVAQGRPHCQALRRRSLTAAARSGPAKIGA